ncbi:MAG: DUF389 domain-containing protein [Planctomycetota bacterium]
MSVLVVIVTPEEAGPLVRWGARFARARDTTLRVLQLGASAQEARVLPTSDPGDQDPVRVAIREALGERLLERLTARFEERKTQRIRALLAEAERDREESDRLRRIAEEELEGAATSPGAPTAESSARPEEARPRRTDESLAALQDEGFLELRSAGGPDSVQVVLRELRAVKATLLVVGKHERFRSGRAGEEDLDPGPALLEASPIDTMLLRAGPESGRKCDRVLVPAAGGPHAQVALGLAAGLAESDQCLVTPLFVEPVAGDEAAARQVGEEQLGRVLRAARIKPDQAGVFPEVVLADSPMEGIQRAATEVPRDLVLVGASDLGFVRRVLFGSVPDRLIEGREGAAVAVVRRARPLAERALERVEGFLRGFLPQLERADRVTLFQRLQDGSRFGVDFAALISLATGIASFGLIQDSPAVVIGAMLVAPLMTPMIGAGLALVQGNTVLVTEALSAILKGFFLALAIGMAAGFGARGLGLLDAAQLTHELLGRGAPNVLDLVVAYLSGLAAAYALARPNLSGALPGVAIAAALVPPIGTVGIALSARNFEVASGAALLFGTNLVAIVLGAASVFRLMGVQPARNQGPTRLWTRRALFGLLLAAMVLTGWFAASLPLWVVREAARPLVARRPQLEAALRELVEEGEGRTLLRMRTLRGERLELVIVCAGAAVTPELAEQLRARTRAILGQEVPLSVVLIRPADVAVVSSRATPAQAP